MLHEEGLSGSSGTNIAVSADGVAAVEVVGGGAASGVGVAVGEVLRDGCLAMGAASGGGDGDSSDRAIDGKIAEKQLPTEGTIMFQIKSGTTELRKKCLNGKWGYVDKFDNVWAKSDIRIKGKPHWDVQLAKNAPNNWWDIAKSKGKDYLNVGLDGEITH